MISKVKDSISSIIFALIMSLETMIIVGLCVHLENHIAQIVLLVCTALLVFSLFFIMMIKTKHHRVIKGSIACLVLPLLFASISLVAYNAIRNNSYSFTDTDNGKESIFADKKVMLIVPHEDDETLLLGGTIEEYVRYGSEVNVVFTTNGDAVENEKTKCTRLREAISALSLMGVDENHIIFLGYGDTWENGESHIYHSESDKVMTSRAGYTSTYGLPEHPAFNDGVPYTRDNMKKDIKNVLLSYRPEVIYCIDYDANCDHRSTSFLFEEAMGEILSEEDAYQPLVFKGFAYSTAMFSFFDYNKRTIASTVKPNPEPYMKETNVYNWDERVRVPVASSSLSRLFRGTDVHKALECHKSQSVYRFAQAAANGDKVFWQRETSSLLYDANFLCGENKVTLLNDFKITDSSNILDRKNPPLNGEGVFVPHDKITVTLSQKKEMDRIVIYDNPSMEDNINNILITFEDGTQIESDQIEKNGSGTEIKFDKREVESFTVEILSSEGNKAGITEIEAYNGITDYGFDYIKLADSDNNFIYDYLMDKDEETFSIVSVGNCSDNYQVTTDSKTCTAKIVGKSIIVRCNKGESCLLTVNDGNGHKDTVRISHPKSFTELDIAIAAENFYWKTFRMWRQKYYYFEFKKNFMDLIEM
ncbi:MAG: PIG-L family deacetylase [Clostridia bacterium]|nr:PIG-L family deacetylase [Clostridia bacterium]